MSGAGKEGVRELENQVEASVSSAQMESKVFAHQIFDNVLPQIDTAQIGEYTPEEDKMLYESRKILGLPKLRVSTTCVRVPVSRSHSISINAEFERPVSVGAAFDAIGAAKGIELVDSPHYNIYPQPRSSRRLWNCLIGRIRVDQGLDNGLSMFISGDNLLRGAALNALLNAEELLKRDLMRVG